MIGVSVFVRARRLGVLAGVGLALLVLASPASAQFDIAQLSGIVRDQQGAIVQGAEVALIEEATKVVRKCTTNDTGYYVAPALPPGSYRVEVSYAGFRTSVRTGVTLNAAAKVQASFTLEPGGKEEEVTVTAEAQPLQADTGTVGKTIESKQIQDLQLNGRNPFALAVIKPGVRGINITGDDATNTFAVGRLSFNGGRRDDNLVTYDGVTALRTRSSLAALGVPQVDALQEIQLLTASYLPEYGRSSGGQMRFVTKSGGHDFHGSLYGFLRDDALDANEWGRNRSAEPEANGAPAPYGQKQLGYTASGPLYLPGVFNVKKDKLFFFWAQEFYRRDNPATNTATVPTVRMRQGDFGELLDPNNPFYGEAVYLNDPATGQPFPNNVIPANRLSPNGLAFLNMFPAPIAGFQQGSDNWMANYNFRETTRKDTLRLDFHPNTRNRISFRFSHYSWNWVDSNDVYGYGKTDWALPSEATALNWTSTLSANLVNELTVGFSRDRVDIELQPDAPDWKRETFGITFPYLYPGSKELENKVPTIDIGGLSGFDGGPYPASSRGPIWQFTDKATWLKGRHALKAGVSFEYSGENDFDQINTANIPGDTNNQNGRFAFTDDRTGGTGNAIANTAMGLFTTYAEIGKKSLTKWRSLGIDAFVQDSWKAKDDLTLEYGVRYAYWPRWKAQCNNFASFDPRYYDKSRAAVVDPATGAVVSGDRLNGIVLPGKGFPSGCDYVEAASHPEYDRLFVGLPRGLSGTSGVFEPRVGLAWTIDPKTVVRLGGGLFHTRITLSDSTLIGGNPPIQNKVGVSNGVADQPGSASGQASYPYVMTAVGEDWKHPKAYTWSVSFQRALPWSIAADVTYVGRLGRDLVRERNINQLQPGTVQANPGVNLNALRPYKGFDTIRVSENAARSHYHGLQVGLDRRFRGGLGFGIAYTFSRSEDNGSHYRDVLYNAYDDSKNWGPSAYDRTHVLVFNYVYELPFWRAQNTLAKKILGGWQLSGVTFFESGAPLWVTDSNDIAGVGDGTGQPWNLVGDTKVSNPGFSQGSGKDSTFWFNPQAFSRPAAGTFGNSPRNNLRGPWTQGWNIGLIKKFRLDETGRGFELRAEAFNFLNHPNLNNPTTNPRSANFGRVTGKSGNRVIQLGAKFTF